MARRNRSSKVDPESSVQHRIDRASEATIQSSWKKPRKPFRDQVTNGASVFCGWGQVLFGHTYENLNSLKNEICDETKGTRNIALYLRDPHVLISLAPQDIFLDPSHTYRLWFERYQPPKRRPKNIAIRRAKNAEDIRKINVILKKRMMVPLADNFTANHLRTSKLVFFLAEEKKSMTPLGVVMGLDHQEIFDDPERGSSLWNLAVDPNAKVSGLGEALVRHLIEFYLAKGKSYLDLSVMHDNKQAIKLYDKLGFERVPVFCVKSKNAINEPLFIAPEVKQPLNPYAEIIIREARRRGISSEILDEENAIFDLSFGGRTITCQESLSELTSAIAYLRCSHKRTTIKVLKAAGLSTPKQATFKTKKQAEEFLARYERIVVKPLVGEQGQGVSVDIRSKTELHEAIDKIKDKNSQIVLEKFHEGIDLRVIVIDFEVVAASIRRPPSVIGDGKTTIRNLIVKQNRRLMAATGGESKIPMDEELSRCLKSQSLRLTSILEEGKEVIVRKTPNLHTGGSLHDVTERLHPKLKEASVEAAKALKIPVVGLDLIIEDVEKSDHVFIEANERPGLANHEPQPTAERFIDLLFPQTKA